jgi:uncharacterized protein (DUF885 family)
VSEMNRIADDLLFGMLSESPDIAAHLGIRDVNGRALANDTLTDFSDDGVAARRKTMADAAAALAAVDETALSASDRTTRDVMRYLVEDGMFWIFHGADGARFPEIAYPLNPVEGAHQVLNTLLVQDHVLATAAEAEAYRMRLKRLPVALHQIREAARARLREGFTPSRAALEQSLTELRSFLSPPLVEQPLLNRLSDSSSAVLRDAETTFTREIVPAYEALMAEMEAQAALDAPAQGLWATPDGDAHYAYLLRGHTTTTMTPAEVHELGLAEAAHLSQRIRERFAQIGISGGSVAEMYRELETLPNARYALSPEGRAEIQRDADAMVRDLSAACARLFDRLPGARCRVDPAPEAQEASAISHYTPPSADGQRAGVFTINLKDTTQRLRWELPILCRHEIMPGHHLQLSLAQELSHLPSFRRAIVFNAYIEGWAKYAEVLPEEQGISDDPYVALCRMRGELYSTVNLALDTGLNAMRWSAERAAEFFSEATGAPRAFGERIVQRSLFHPGQLCSYKIGMRKMFELKSRLERARGSRFRIQEFHSLVLEEGALPLSLLERRVDDAIARH